MVKEFNIRYHSFQDLFESNVLYKVPFFQRSYAWEKEQWSHFHEDIEEQILKNLSNDIEERSLKDLEEDLKNQRYFFGSIVVLRSKEDKLDIREFDIIDGQQRITTAYLYVALIARELEKRQKKGGLPDDIQNHLHYLKKDILVNKNIKPDEKIGDYAKLKVFSTKADRIPTYKTVFYENPKSPLLRRIDLFFTIKRE